MTSKHIDVMIRYRIKLSGARNAQQKGKDMTTMNRLYSFNSEHQNAPLGYHEWSFDIMRSFKVKQKRWNCVDRSKQS